MTPQTTTRLKILTYALIVVGFAILIALRIWIADASDSPVAFALAGVGTLCLIAAGLLARMLKKSGTSN
jgi:hypothetical protein